MFFVFSVELPSDWTRKPSLTHKIVLTLWHQCLSLAWLIGIVVHGIQIWVWTLITLPPTQVCIAIFNTMNATTRESKIFVDSVSGLIWVIFSHENLLLDSTILTPLNFPLSLKCLLIDNTGLSWSRLEKSSDLRFHCTVFYSCASLCFYYSEACFFCSHHILEIFYSANVLSYHRTSMHQLTWSFFFSMLSTCFVSHIY